MVIELKNVGKISSACIEINGITLMAGTNSTGKSTVSKMLFCLFNSFFEIEKQIEQERKEMIGHLIASNYHVSTNRLTRRFDVDEFAGCVIKKSASYYNNEQLMEDLRDFYFQADKNFEKYLDIDFLSAVSEKVMQILNVSNEEVFVAVFQKRLQAEFNMQINNIYSPGSCSEVTLRIKDKEVNVTISNNDKIEINNSLSLNTEVIYLDDPLALDFRLMPQMYRETHKDHLKRKLLRYNRNTLVKDVIGEIIATKKLDDIFDKLNNVCRGELVRKRDNPRSALAYREGNSETLIDIKNVSTGIKTFLILKTLLINGNLEENGIVVMDEPEIHLHPDWQLVFAELIVLLQKEYNMHILINTHSPYFLNAIEVYSHKYEIADRCKYYLAEDIDSSASIADVTDNIEKIYEKLSRSLQVLENERYP